MLRQAVRLSLAALVCAPRLAVAFVVPNIAPSSVPGSPFVVQGDAATTGASMMFRNFFYPANDTLLASQGSTVGGIPADATVQAAYLFWSGTLNPPGGSCAGSSGPTAPDTTVTLTLPSGGSSSVTSEIGCGPYVIPGGGACNPRFYYCRGNVTAAVAAQASGFNGAYTLSGFEADVADLVDSNGDGQADTCASFDPLCQAKYGSWSLVIVYASATAAAARHVDLLDGYNLLDHRDGPGGSTATLAFSIAGLAVSSPPAGTLTSYVMEGDEGLGEPPQDTYATTNPLYCTDCEDYLRFEDTFLADSVGWPGNVFNSNTTTGGGYGLDIDTFNVSALLAAGGPQTVTVEIGAGTGPVRNPCNAGNNFCQNGGGELFALGWVLLSVGTPSPNLLGSTKSAAPAFVSPSGTVTYTVNVQNSGTAAASAVVVTDTLGSDLDYVAGSARIDGVACGAACSLSGATLTVDLGGIAAAPADTNRVVTFDATIDPAIAGGTTVCNRATIDSAETAPVTTSATSACVSVATPALGTINKTDVDLDGAFQEPDDLIQYSVTIPNTSSVTASNVRFLDDMPATMQLIFVASISDADGVIDASSIGAGGANGTGRVDLQDLDIPPGGSVTVSFVAQIASEAELAALGLGPDGLQVCNQGFAQATWLAPDAATNDPATGAALDPTCFTTTFRPVLSGASKTVSDVDGAPPEPGDVLRYTITLPNTGNRAATVDVTDSMPPATTGFTLVSATPGVTFTPAPAGANGTGLMAVNDLAITAGATHTIVFDVTILASAASGQEIANCADYAVAEEPTENSTRCAPTLTVVAGPVLSTASKTVLDANGGALVPGDHVVYTIAIPNSGNQPATGVQVSDPVDANLAVTSISAGGVLAGGVITWTPPDIAVGATTTLSFEADVIVPTANGTSICNTATIDSTETAPMARSAPCLTVSSRPSFTTSSKTATDLDGDGLFEPGDVVRYAITVANSGTETATGVVVTDTVPSGFVTAGAERTFAAASLAPGASAVFAFDETLASPLVGGRSICNAFTVDSDQTAPATFGPTACFTVTAAPALAVAKGVTDLNDGASVQPGDALLYTITVANSGNSAAMASTVTDAVPANLTAITPMDGGSLAGGTITWPAATVEPGTPRIVRFQASVVSPLANGTTICNSASAQASNFAGSATSSAACVTVTSLPDLGGSTKSVTDLDGGTVEPGDTLRYTITIPNGGAAPATGVTVTDAVEPNLAVTAISGGGTLAGGTITWTPPDIPAGATTTLTFDAAVASPLADGTSICNSVVLDSAETTPLARAAPCVTVVSQPSFAGSSKIVADLDGDGVFEPGDVVRYTLTAENSGTATATTIVVEDTTASGLVGAGGTATFTAASVAAGASATFVFDRTITSPLAGGTIICNSFTVDSDQTATASFGPTACFTVTAAPALNVTKSVTDVNGGDAQPDDTLAYTITVENGGNAAATASTVTDEVPATLTAISPQDGGTLSGSTITWPAATIEPGPPRVVRFRATVVSPLAEGTVVCNSAEADAENFAGTATSAPACVTVVSRPDLSTSSKSYTDLNEELIAPGDTLRFTIVLVNTGTAAATGVSVSDAVSGSLTAVVPLDGGSFVGGVVTWPASTVTAGATVLRRFDAQVVLPLADGTAICNSATISSTEAAPLTVSLPACAVVNSAPRFASSSKGVVDLDGGVVEPGDTLQYTLTVRNSGSATGTAVAVADTIPAGTTVADAGGGTVSAGQIRWSLGSVAPGAAAQQTRIFTVVLDAAIENGTAICNQAFVDSAETLPVGTNDPTTAIPGDATCVTVISQPNLGDFYKLAFDADGAPYRPGDTVAYVLTFTNTGSSTATGVVVTDTLPATLAGGTASDGGVFAGATATWDATTTPALAAVAPGASVALVLSATIVTPLDDGTAICNQAVLTSPELAVPVASDDATTFASDDCTGIAVAAAPVLSAGKSVVDENGGDVLPGDVLRYAITVANAGDALARDVVVTDALPATLVAEDDTLTFALGDLAPGAPATVEFLATVVSPLANGTVICNAADVTSGAMSAATPDACVTVVSRPDFTTATKTVAGAPGGVANPGDALTYTITVTNTGDETATGVVVTDVLDENLDAPTPLDGGVYDAATRTVTWTIASLAPDESDEVRFTALVALTAQDGAIVENQAVVTSPQTPGEEFLTDDPLDAAVDDPTEITIAAVERLEIYKSVEDLDGGDTHPGDRVRYTLRVVNEGQAAAIDVVVTDDVPAELTEILIGQGGTSVGALLTWSSAGTPGLALLAPGAEIVLEFTARVTAPLDDGTRIANQARARADGIASEPSDDPATAAIDDPTVLVITSRPELRFSTKSVRDLDGGAVDPGDVLEYAIRVVNLGDADATGVVLTDPIPTFTELLSDRDPSAGVEVHTAGAPDGVVRAGEDGATTFTFRVRVSSVTPAGAVIANQAFLASAEAGVQVSDDPRTPEIGDPTVVVVGAGPTLAATTKLYDAAPIDDDGDGAFDVGEVVQYRVSIQNLGSAPATRVVFEDDLDPEKLSWVAGSLRMGGVPVTDAADGDAGAALGGSIRVAFGTLAAGGRVEVAYRARLLAEGMVGNQGIVESVETPPEPTDADGNDANGDQVTIVPVGDAAPGAISADKSVSDLGGGAVEPGDELLYAITVRNAGTRALEGLRVVDPMPGQARIAADGVVAPPGTNVTVETTGAANGRGAVVVGGLALAPGQSAIVLVRVRLDRDAARGASVCNVATVSSDALDPLRPEACVLVGKPAGTGSLAGRVFRDIGADDHSFGRGDRPLAGWQAQLVLAGDVRGRPIAVASTDEDGRYRLLGVPPGPYELRVLSPLGVEYARRGGVVVAAGALADLDAPIDPSGVVYDSKGGRPLAGARVTLCHAETPGDDRECRRVPDDALLPGQQGQPTDASGYYRFDVRPGKFRLEVAPPGPSMAFPSTRIPPRPGFARVGPENEVVPSDEPDPRRAGADLTYYLRFDIGGPEDEVRNNHVPVDALTDLIRLDKRADKREATVGDVIGYTITVANGSTRDLRASGGTGVTVRDVMPVGFRLSRDSVALVRGSGDGRLAANPPPIRGWPSVSRVVDFGPVDLPAGETFELHYQVIVGLEAKPGHYVNRAVLLGSGGVPISNEDEAVVRVAQDPDFDQGFLFGKVFCDGNGDGRQQPGEPGVGAATIYLDSGDLVVTDATGKYHFREMDPGVHLVKIDAGTLPPPGRLTTEAARVVEITRGLPAKVNFGVKCAYEKAAPQVVVRAEKKKPSASALAERPRTSVTFQGDIKAMTLLADDAPVVLPEADVVVTPSGEASLGADWGAVEPHANPPPNFARRDSPAARPVGRGEAPRPVGRAEAAAIEPAAVFLLRAKAPPGAKVRGWQILLFNSSEESSRGASVVGLPASPALRKGEEERVPAHEIVGAGDVPEEIAWDGTIGPSRDLAAAGVYVYQLRVAFSGGWQAASRRRTFGIGLGTRQIVSEQKIAGAFAGSMPRGKTRVALVALARKLSPKDGGERVEVVEIEAQAQQAQAAADYLARLGIAAARLRVVASPSAGAALVLRVVRVEESEAAAVPPAAPVRPAAFVAGVEAKVARDTFARNAPIPPDGRIAVEMTAADGRRAAIELDLRGGAKLAPPPRVSLRVEGELKAPSLRVRGLSVDLRLLEI
ncbi:MAG: hypothetical protein AABZ30_13845, partial [Myxococcota bacterium]